MVSSLIKEKILWNFPFIRSSAKLSRTFACTFSHTRFLAVLFVFSEKIQLTEISQD